MLNVVVPIVNNAKKYRKILNSLANTEDINVYVGVVSSEIANINYLKCENIEIIEFQNGSEREEIINSLQKYLGYGAILIMRKPITENEFNSFVKTNKDVVVCKNKLGSVKNFFYTLWQNILKLVLGVRLYDGDTSVIYFAEDIATVILGSSNLSYNSRVDRWRGIEQGSVFVEGEKVDTPKDIKSNIRNMVISLIAILIGATVTTVVSIFASVNVIIGLLLFCLDAICLIIVLILLIMTIFNNTVGKKSFGYAAETEDNEISDYQIEDKQLKENTEVNERLLSETEDDNIEFNQGEVKDE